MFTKAGHRSTLAFLRFCVIAATGIRKHTQVELLWITRRIRRISAFPSNSECLDPSVFTSRLPATKRNSRTISTRATDVIFERKHCSRRRRHTQVEITSPHNSATRKQSDVIAGTVPESPNARTQGRPVAGLRGFSKLKKFQKNEITMEVGGWVGSGFTRKFYCCKIFP